VEYGGPYHVVLVRNFLHHFYVETCTELLRNAHKARVPAALIATLEFVPVKDGVSPPPAAAFSLIMLVSTAAGMRIRFAELEAAYRNAGFSQVTANRIPNAAHTVVQGIKAR
jgi:hypothetical protein